MPVMQRKDAKQGACMWITEKPCRGWIGARNVTAGWVKSKYKTGQF